MQTDPPPRFLGLSVVAASAILSWILFGTVDSVAPSLGIVTLGIVFGTLYYLVPSAQKNLANWFHLATFPIRWSMTWIAMILLYYLAVTPIGIWYRLSGKSIHRTSSDATSNWTKIEIPNDPESYFRSY